MDRQTAAQLLRVSELSSQQKIESAFLAQVQEIGEAVRATKDPGEQAKLKGQLKQCILAKKILLPNAELVPKEIKQSVGRSGGGGSPNRTADRPTGAGARPGMQGGPPGMPGTPVDRSFAPPNRPLGPAGAPVEQSAPEGGEEQAEPSLADLARQARRRRRESSKRRRQRRRELEELEEEDELDEDEVEESSPDIESEHLELDVDVSADNAQINESAAAFTAARQQDKVEEEPGFEDKIKSAAKLLAEKRASVSSGTWRMFFIGACVCVGLIVGVLLLQGAPTPERLPSEIELKLKRELTHLMQKTSAQMVQIKEYQEQLIDRIEELKMDPETDKLHLQTLIDVNSIKGATLLAQQSESERWRLFKKGEQAYAESRWLEARILLEGAHNSYSEILEKLSIIESATLSRLTARESKESFENWFKETDWKELSVVGKDENQKWIRAENLYLEQRYEVSKGLHLEVNAHYKSLMEHARSLYLKVEALSQYEQQWSDLPWGDEIVNSTQYKDLEEGTEEVHQVIRAGNIEGAENAIQPLLSLYQTALKGRQEATSARRRVERLKNAYEAYEKQENYKPLVIADKMVNKGIQAMWSGTWDVALKAFLDAADLYDSELQSLGALKTAIVEKGQVNQLKSRFEAEAKRTIPVMVSIKGGSFIMGDQAKLGYSSELPAHKVRVKSFKMSKFEITFAQYDRFAKATGREKPDDNGWGRGSRPVVNVSWEDAEAYTKWLSIKAKKKIRLPTEAQWEYAARAGTSSLYYWGNDFKHAVASCKKCGNAWDGRYPTPVGVFAPNKWGLYDMVGNASEWVQDCWNGDYVGAPTNGRAQKIGYCQLRVVRGGGWDDDPWLLRSSSRYSSVLVEKVNFRGFRVVSD